MEKKQSIFEKLKAGLQKTRGNVFAALFSSEERVDEEFFEELEEGTINLAAIISLFEDEQEQREVAGLFNTRLMKLETRAEQEKAFHDIVVAVKRSSLDRLSQGLGSDVAAISKVIEGKKALEELSKTHISLNHG